MYKEKLKKAWREILNFFRKARGIPVEAQNIRFCYDKKLILRNINLKARKGQIIAVVGKSGSGKTTFLKLITGVEHGCEGRVRIFSKPLLVTKDRLGYVPQQISVIPNMNVLDNIKFFGGLHGLSETESMKSGLELLKMLRLHEKADALPTQLSGGQKTRLNIVTALLHKPDVIILDEPFVGLDFFNRVLLWHFLESLKKKGKTVILTTHLLSEAGSYADRIFILKKGRIMISGTADSIEKKLKTHYIMEVQFQYLSKEDVEAIKEWSRKKTVEILDRFGKYIMFSLETKGQRSYLLQFLDKRDMKYKETSFRKPNLDEVFLRTDVR
ncbi:ATP-binding cassette domain-containing protein [Candidatus Woesearchaeota archaeon]|nr:ATP-binding cassette domain-containing protein [Candidatus Woesearchaeota archaeon]